MTAALDAEKSYPHQMTIGMSEESAHLYDALDAAHAEDGIDRTNRVRGLVHVWSMDPNDPDAPTWLAELQELVAAHGVRYKLEIEAAANRRRSAPRRPRKPRSAA